MPLGEGVGFALGMAMKTATNRRENGGTLDKAQTAKYVCDMVLELRNTSKNAGLVFLTQLLEMTYHEAFMISNQIAPPQADLAETNRIIAAAKAFGESRSRAG
jgi:hypothetical protein